ncbi:MAG: hypothetical protein WAK31_28295 [Chthoniobacterales bacterium]
MTILEEIEEKVALLSRQEFFELVRRLRERHNDEWDKQIEEDVAGGRLDFLLHEVDQAIATGRTKPLDEICNDS